MCWHYNKHSCNSFQMFRWSSSVLNPEPASDVIRLEESGTINLTIQWTSRVMWLIPPHGMTPTSVFWTSVSMLYSNENGCSHCYLSPCTKATPSHTGLQMIVKSIIGFVLHIASHKYWLEFDNSRPAGIWTWLSWTKSGHATIVLCSIDSNISTFEEIIRNVFYKN